MDYVERFVRRVRGCAADEGAAVFGKYTIRAGEVCAVVGLARGGGRGPRRNAQERRYYTVFDSLKLAEPMLNPIGSNGRRNFYAMRAPGGAGSGSQSHFTSQTKNCLTLSSHSRHDLTSPRLQPSLSPLTSVVTSMSRRAPSFSLHTYQHDRIRFGVSCAARYRVSASEVSNEERGDNPMPIEWVSGSGSG